MYCTNCGAPLEDDFRFCANCGAPIPQILIPEPDFEPYPEDATGYDFAASDFIESLEEYEVAEPVQEVTVQDVSISEDTMPDEYAASEPLQEAPAQTGYCAPERLGIPEAKGCENKLSPGRSVLAIGITAAVIAAVSAALMAVSSYWASFMPVCAAVLLAIISMAKDDSADLVSAGPISLVLLRYLILDILTIKAGGASAYGIPDLCFRLVLVASFVCCAVFAIVPKGTAYALRYVCSALFGVQALYFLFRTIGLHGSDIFFCLAMALLFASYALYMVKSEKTDKTSEKKPEGVSYFI